MASITSLYLILICLSFNLALTSSHIHNYTLNAADNSDEELNHNWVGPSGHLLIVVDANGNGDFGSVQAAVDAVPTGNRQNVLILITAEQGTGANARKCKIGKLWLLHFGYPEIRRSSQDVDSTGLDDAGRHYVDPKA